MFNLYSTNTGEKMLFYGRKREVRINYFEQKFMRGIRELELIGSSFSLVAGTDSLLPIARKYFCFLLHYVAVIVIWESPPFMDF